MAQISPHREPGAHHGLLRTQCLEQRWRESGGSWGPLPWREGRRVRVLPPSAPASLLGPDLPSEFHVCSSPALGSGGAPFSPGHPLSPPTPPSRSPGTEPDPPTCREDASAGPRGLRLERHQERKLRGCPSPVMTQLCPGVWRSPRGPSHTLSLAEGSRNHGLFRAGSGARTAPQSLSYPHRLRSQPCGPMVQPGTLEPGGPGLNPSQATH